MSARELVLVSVVDDDESIRRSLSNLLRSAGYGVETFDSAEDFLARADPSVKRCMVLDFKMGAMGGLDLLRQLSARGALPPTVVLTAYTEAAWEQRAREAGALELLLKPFQPQVILEALARAAILAS